MTKKIKADFWVSYYVPAVIILISGLVVIDWAVVEIGARSLRGDFVAMKFGTALCFLLVGVSMLLKGNAFYMKMGFVAATSIYMALSFFFHQRASFLPQLETADAIATIMPGFPSWGTLAGFIFFSVGMVFRIRIMGWGIIFICGLPVLGYLIGIPIFYYDIPDFSTGMSVHGSLLMLHVGGWMLYRLKTKN